MIVATIYAIEYMKHVVHVIFKCIVISIHLKVNFEISGMCEKPATRKFTLYAGSLSAHISSIIAFRSNSSFFFTLDPTALCRYKLKHYHAYNARFLYTAIGFGETQSFALDKYDFCSLSFVFTCSCK